MSLQNILNPPTMRNFSFLPPSPSPFTPSQKTLLARTLKIPGKLCCVSPSFQYSINQQDGFIEDEDVIGDCLVFEEGIFEDPYIENDTNHEKPPLNKYKSRKKLNEVEPENLVPDQWREVQAEINITKKDRRKIARELEYGRRVEKRKQGYLPLRSVSLEEYKAYKEAKLAQLKPVILDNPTSFPVKEQDLEDNEGERKDFSSVRVQPKNPRWAVYGKGLEDVSEFFNSGNYVPGSKNSDGPRKLFTTEEKVLLNRRVPDLQTATSEKWQPLHTLAACGEFYLVDTLLKHNVDINAVDKDGFTALQKAIIGKKQAVTNYLLRESANPFVCDKDGATLLHHAVQTASSPAIKVLLLYNVDINLQDNYGWTPLHLAVQTRRTDIVRLLLIRGADKTTKNKDGLTPLELCLHSGHDLRTFEIIKLLKKLPKSRAG